MEDITKDLKKLIESHVDADLKSDAFSIVFDAVESSIAAIIISDNHGHIIYVNTAFLRMFEYENKREVLGMNVVDFFASKEIKKLSDIEMIIDITDGETEEFTVYRKSGEKFFVEASYSGVTNSEGRLLGRMVSLIDITKRKIIEQERKGLVQKLQDALDKIKTLRGLIPICASCKNIRDDKGYWRQIEEYIHEHSELQFSHGICPDCAKKLYPELSLWKDEDAS